MTDEPPRNNEENKITDNELDMLAQEYQVTQPVETEESKSNHGIADDIFNDSPDINIKDEAISNLTDVEN